MCVDASPVAHAALQDDLLHAFAGGGAGPTASLPTAGALTNDSDITLPWIAKRHPQGNAFIERIFLTLKKEAVWPKDLGHYDQAFEAVPSPADRR